MPLVIARLREARRVFEHGLVGATAAAAAGSAAVTVPYAPGQRGLFRQTMKLPGPRPETGAHSEHGSELFVEPRPPAKPNRVRAGLFAAVMTAALALLVFGAIQRARLGHGAAAGAPDPAVSVALVASPASVTQPSSVAASAPSPPPDTPVMAAPSGVAPTPAPAASRRPIVTAAPPASSTPGIATKRNWF